MANTDLCGKFIRTFKGNLLCCMEVNGREFFFAMTPSGQRFFFKNETERGKYLNVQEWVHALATWDGAKIETLAGEDLANASLLAKTISASFVAFMSPAQIATLPSDHMTYFK